MSVAVPPEVTGQPAPFCALCGRPMEPDQEWCLDCGAARTVIAPAPDWRVPILVIGTVVLIIAGLLVFAVSRLDSAGQVTVIKTTAAGQTATVGAWQPGLDGYTVILASEPSQAAARSEATRLVADHVAAVGVLNTSQHPQLRAKGAWEVFSGRYPSYALAKAAAARATKHGQPQAVPALVQRPGQG